MKQHEQIEKLNVQAHSNALNNRDPFVLEAFLTFEKMQLLVHELIAIELWRTNIYPQVANKLCEKNSTRLYFILYHEATLLNLLEVLLYHETAAENIGDAMIDLVDYCARSMNSLLIKCTNKREEIHLDLDSSSEVLELPAYKSIERQRKELEFKMCVVAVGILRYITEHISKLSLSTMNRILDTHDFLVTMVPLVENPPWTRRTDKVTS